MWARHPRSEGCFAGLTPSHPLRGPASLDHHRFQSWQLGLTGVCGLLRALQSDGGRAGTGNQARLGPKSPSLLGMSSGRLACWLAGVREG